MSKLIDALKRAEQLRKEAAQAASESTNEAAPAAALSAEDQSKSLQDWVDQRKSPARDEVEQQAAPQPETGFQPPMREQAISARDSGARLPSSNSNPLWWAMAALACALGGFWLGGQQKQVAAPAASVLKAAPTAISRPVNPIESGEPVQLKLDAALRAEPAAR